jgi:hypothetical protein
MDTATALIALAKVRLWAKGALRVAGNDPELLADTKRTIATAERTYCNIIMRDDDTGGTRH